MRFSSRLLTTAPSGTLPSSRLEDGSSRFSKTPRSTSVRFHDYTVVWPLKWDVGARVDACTEKATVKEWAGIISEIIGKPVRTNGLTGDMYKDYSFLTNMGIPEELILNYKGFYEASVGPVVPIFDTSLTFAMQF